jgi:hypothetical protein
MFKNGGKMALLTQNPPVLCQALIITSAFKKNAIYLLKFF